MEYRGFAPPDPCTTDAHHSVLDALTKISKHLSGTMSPPSLLTPTGLRRTVDTWLVLQEVVAVRRRFLVLLILGSLIALLLSGCDWLWPQPVVVDFELTPASGSKPLLVDFTPILDGAPVTYAWDFGDGSTSTEEAPSHVYYAAGTYTVTLAVVYDSGAAGAAEKADCIEVRSGFTATPTRNLYWLNPNTDAIRCGPATGGTVATLVSSGARGRAMDVGLGQIYWWDGNNLVRTSTDGGSPTSLFYTYGAPEGLCVDEIHSKVYWTSQTIYGSGGILRCDANGGNNRIILSEPNDKDAQFVAFDAAANRLYYLETHHDYSVQPRATNDTEAVTVTSWIYWMNLSNEATNRVNLALSQGVGGLAIDAGLSAGARYIYWTNSAAGEIERCKIDGSARVVLISGLSSPGPVAVDIQSGKLYWADAGGIHRADLDGTDQETIYPSARAAALVIY